MPHEPRALTEAEAAQRLAVSASTLRNWRHQRKGPAFQRFGRAVRYLEADLDAFMGVSRETQTRSIRRL